MSEHAPARPISLPEMNGRIDELELQRNQALTRCSLLSGERALALELLGRANAEIDRLTSLLNPGPDAAAAPVAPAPNEPLAPAGAVALTH